MIRLSPSTAHRELTPDRYHLALMALRLGLRCGGNLPLPFTPEVVPGPESTEDKQ